MARYGYAMTEEKIARFIKEKRGKGEGKDYKPWLRIQDVPSSGRRSRPHSMKTGREHHLLSDLETAVFYLYEWSDDILDVREQYPLDRAVTQQIAKELGLKHPEDPSTRCQIVMTTDFLFTRREGIGTRTIARTVKPSSALEARVLDKLEIERRYWANQGVDWGIITEREIPKARVQNLEWVHEYQSMERLVVPYVGYWEDRCDQFINFLDRTAGITLEKLCRELEENHGFAVGEPLTVIRHLLANKRLLMDMNKPRSMKDDISVLSLPEDASQRKTIHAA